MSTGPWVITGASGLIGSALARDLTSGGDEVRPIGRNSGYRWDPATGQIDVRAFDGAATVVHLAGANIAGHRWTDRYRRAIRDSRVDGTRLLAQTLAAMPSPPGVLVCASAVGFYGDRGDELLAEASPPGKGFLPEVCQAWEAAADPARAAGIRVVHLRLGMVLAPDGGALGKMLPVFRLGLAGRLGNGRQWWSWIALGDVLRLIRHVAADARAAGPLVAAAPEPVTNSHFTQTLARVLHRPAFLPAPAFVLRLALGEMADALLLASTRARSAQLPALGFAFAQPELEPALRALLDKPARSVSR